MAETYLDLYKDALEVSNEQDSKMCARYDNLTDTLHFIFAQYSDLVLPAEKFTGPTLPCSPEEDFALAITQMLHRKEVTMRLLPEKVI
jgi:hypothetical protein